MEFTDFLIWMKGGQVVEFRHSAKTVNEFWEVRDELIFDIYGSQCITRNEIRVVQLDPRPYYIDFHKVYGYIPLGYPPQLWKFISSLSEEEKERIKKAYYDVKEETR